MIAIVLKARKLGLVKHGGYRNTQNPLAHGTPASFWIKELVPTPVLSPKITGENHE